MPAASFDQVVSLCKRRGFIYPGSAVYGGRVDNAQDDRLLQTYLMEYFSSSMLSTFVQLDR